MPFIALRFDADAEAAERWADALIDAGALSVDVVDPDAGTSAEVPLYDEPGADPAPRWRNNRLTVLLADGADPREILARAATVVGEAMPAHSVDAIPDADWVRATRSQFQPIRVNANLWIVPTWCEPVDARAINVRIDPGLAFGTGDHPTTRLCLRWLAENPPSGKSLLDYGCGSGVLAIAAAKLGAAPVAGVDVDPEAIATSRANARANAVIATFTLPEELTPSSFDVVMANILAGPIELLAPLLAQRTSDGGRVTLSGILESQVDPVVAAYSRWFNIDVWAREEGWATLTGVRSGS
jgi:ribosomal protein L11 methyltransferase